MPVQLWTVAADATGLERRSCGVSFGGGVAQSYATRHPEHPGKLILSSTRSRRGIDRSVAVFTRLGGERAGEIARAFFETPTVETGSDYRERCMPLYYRRTKPDPSVASRIVRNTSRLQLHYFEHDGATANFLAELGRIQCPTLVMGGEDDPICPIEDMAETAAALPPDLVRFERFAGCGHHLRYEDPERSTRVIREFILS